MLRCSWRAVVLLLGLLVGGLVGGSRVTADHWLRHHKGAPLEFVELRNESAVSIRYAIMTGYTAQGRSFSDVALVSEAGPAGKPIACRCGAGLGHVSGGPLKPSDPADSCRTHVPCCAPGVRAIEMYVGLEGGDTGIQLCITSSSPRAGGRCSNADGCDPATTTGDLVGVQVTYLGLDASKKNHRFSVRRRVMDDVRRVRLAWQTIACTSPVAAAATDEALLMATEIKGSRKTFPGGPFTHAELRNKRNTRKITQASIELWRFDAASRVIGRNLVDATFEGKSRPCASTGSSSDKGWWAEPDCGTGSANAEPLIVGATDDNCRFYKPASSAFEGISYVLLSFTHTALDDTDSRPYTVCLGPDTADDANCPASATDCGNDAHWLRWVVASLVADPDDANEYAIELKRFVTVADGTGAESTVTCKLPPP
jgi:hypothetical protein